MFSPVWVPCISWNFFYASFFIEYQLKFEYKFRDLGFEKTKQNLVYTLIIASGLVITLSALFIPGPVLAL